MRQLKRDAITKVKRTRHTGGHVLLHRTFFNTSACDASSSKAIMHHAQSMTHMLDAEKVASLRQLYFCG